MLPISGKPEIGAVIRRLSVEGGLRFAALRASHLMLPISGKSEIGAVIRRLSVEGGLRFANPPYVLLREKGIR
jgi:hypothetical protein